MGLPMENEFPLKRHKKLHHVLDTPDDTCKSSQRVVLILLLTEKSFLMMLILRIKS